MFDLSEEGIRTLISRGEGSNVEFKTTLVPTKVLDAFVSAFLNSDGGIILFGVGDSGEIIGLSEQERKVALSRFHKVAREMPRAMRDGVNFRYGNHLIDGKNVAFLEASYKPFMRTISRRSPVVAFVIESGLILLALISLWYLARFVPNDTALGFILRTFHYVQTLPGLLTFGTALECFLALVFYGTSYEVTPVRLLNVFVPISGLSKRTTVARQRRERAELEDVSEKQEATPSTSTVKPEEVQQKKLSSPVAEYKPADVITAEVVEDEVAKDKADELFREVSERASFLADRMEKRTIPT